jgi:hypothetical protein
LQNFILSDNLEYRDLGTMESTIQNVCLLIEWKRENVLGLKKGAEAIINIIYVKREKENELDLFLVKK